MTEAIKTGETNARKRLDIQGIRGFAIGSVLAFHLFPHFFPVGFIGVDIFFVLSGYLMSSILAREECITLSVLLAFYSRRFKRIIPMFALILALIFLFVPLIFFTAELERFLLDAPWSAAFATNIYSYIRQSSYWDQVLDANLLTHTWSLGVEVQYYLLVPLIIVCLRNYHGVAARTTVLVLLASGSLLCQLLGEETFAFNALPSRIWEFLAGSMAFEIQSHNQCKVEESSDISAALLSKQEYNEEAGEEDQRPSVKTSSRLFGILLAEYSAALLLMSICFLPSNYYFRISIIRILAVSLTAILLFLGSHSQLNVVSNSNRMMVYAGDISYVVYLVHWPVIVTWKSYFDEPQLNSEGVLCCLLVTLLISTTLHHSAEKFFIESSTIISILFVAFLYCFMLSAYLLRVPQAIANNRESSYARSEAAEWNRFVSLSDSGISAPFPQCQADAEGSILAGGNVGDLPYQCAVIDESSTSNFSILILGNSVAARASRVLWEILKGRTKTFRVYATSGCQPLKHMGICDKFYAAALQLAKNMRPSVILLSYDLDKNMNLEIKNISTDKYVKEFETFLLSLSNTTEHLIVDDLYPVTGRETEVAFSLYKRLSRKQPIDGFRRDYRLVEEFLSTHANYFRRMDAIRGIPNLIRNNVSSALCAEEANVCWWYNRSNNHSYFSDRTHLSPDGLALVKATYERIFSSILAIV